MRSSVYAVALACGFASTHNVCARPFNEQDMFVAYLKLSEIDDFRPYVQDYKNVFRSYRTSSENEFGGLSEDDRVVNRLKNLIQKFDTKENFELPISVPFGEYDFQNKSFNFHPLSASSMFNAGSYQVSFINTKKFDGLPMEPDRAKSFLQSHSYRNVPINVTFVPVSSVEDTRKIKAEITSIEVFSDDRRQNLVYRFDSK